VAVSTTRIAQDRHQTVARGQVLFRAPPLSFALPLIGLSDAFLAFLIWWPNLTRFAEGFLVVFFATTLVGTALTTPIASALGGRFEFRRSVFLSLTVVVIELPVAALWRAAWQVWPAITPSLSLLAVFLVGPMFWFRHLTLYGVSKPVHSRTLAASLVAPVLYLAALFALVPPTVALVLAALAFLVLAFVCAIVLLHAADRPIRREFQVSGVSLIRPLLDHVGNRDPAATRALEAFFLKGAIAADLKVSLLTFSSEGRVRATVALPTVHPGPFAALGASDLPRKLSERLGPGAGLVLVPHTPSDHDLDLPSEDEVDRVSVAARGLLEELPPAGPARASPLVSPYPGSLARAQLLGNMVLVVVSQAPSATDDIAYSVADRVLRDLVRDGIPPVALVDAHNSYVEGQGDIAYGSPAAEKLAVDTRAAVQAALAATKDGPVEVGVAARGGYSTGEDGIGPQGIRALVVRAAGTTSGYVLIDGNNLVVGQRDPIVRELLGVVDAAEVLTTDNHVVHEVDGGINPVGERIPLPTLTHEAREVLAEAKGNLGPADVRFGTREIPAVRVLGPGLTARLLTSLGDTLSMFANMFPATLLLLLTSSLVVAFAIR
jgi:putative membrane protein